MSRSFRAYLKNDPAMRFYAPDEQDPRLMEQWRQEWLSEDQAQHQYQMWLEELDANND
jgi:hypothetical protein